MFFHIFISIPAHRDRRGPDSVGEGQPAGQPRNSDAAEQGPRPGRPQHRGHRDQDGQAPPRKVRNAYTHSYIHAYITYSINMNVCMWMMLYGADLAIKWVP